MKRFSKITTTRLARICGVSQGTVDRALHGRGEIAEKTRERILSVAREYDYIPTVHGSENGNSMLIGVVLYDLYNEFFSKLAMSLVEAAKEIGYSIIFQFSDKDLATERSALEYFDFIGVDGIVLFSVGSDSEEYKNYLHSLKKPLVLIGNPMYGLPFFGVDDEAAMHDLTLRLCADAPRGPVLYFAPILKRDLHEENCQRRRLSGFVRAMTHLARPFRVVTEVEELSDFGAIVCSTDYYALKALRYLQGEQDLKIAGFDNISLLKLLDRRVLTVEYSTDRIARQSIHYLLGNRYSNHIPYTVLYNGE